MLKEGWTVAKFLWSLVSYFKQRERKETESTVEQYLEWVRRQDHRELTEGIEKIIALTRDNATFAKDLFEFVKAHSNTVEESLAETMASGREAAENTRGLNQKLDALLERVGEPNEERRRHRLKVSARLLELAAKDMKGAGASCWLNYNSESLAAEGEAMADFEPPVGPVEMMVMDLVGGVTENRISLILLEDGSFLIRAFDALGRETEYRTQPCEKGVLLRLRLTWQKRRITFSVNDRQVCQFSIPGAFERMCSLLLIGIDIDGKYSATEAFIGPDDKGVNALRLRGRPRSQ